MSSRPTDTFYVLSALGAVGTQVEILAEIASARYGNGDHERRESP
jgi:hypothetical protein